MKPQLPQIVEAYVRATNNHDAPAFIALFADDAVVDDIGREFRGLDAIKAWSDREIFDAQVTLDIIDTAYQDGEIVVTAKADGTFDRTGLPANAKPFRELGSYLRSPGPGGHNMRRWITPASGSKEPPRLADQFKALE